MSDVLELLPCKLWLAMGAAIQVGLKRSAKPGHAIDLTTAPVAITARHPIARISQSLRGGGGGTQLGYGLDVVTTKPGWFDVSYAGHGGRPERGVNVRWPEHAGWTHCSASQSGKTLSLSMWVDGRGAALQRVFAESPFMRHAQRFVLESKLSYMRYGHDLGLGMTSLIEGEWRASDEHIDQRWQRLGFELFDANANRVLTAEESDAMLDGRKNVPSSVVCRHPDDGAEIAFHGAVTLEVEWGRRSRASRS